MTSLLALLSLLIGIVIGQVIYLVGVHRGWWESAP
jgi:hypothetical protein